MTTKTTAQNDLDQAFEAWTKAIKQFDAAQYNTIPFEGSWTAGQVVQHLSLANSGFNDILFGEVKEPESSATEKVGQLKDIFLNFEAKMQAPDFVLPEFKDYDATTHLAKTVGIKATTEKAIVELDPDAICLAFELPVFGFLTRKEATYFIIYHTIRHTNQLNRIYQKLAEQE